MCEPVLCAYVYAALMLTNSDRNSENSYPEQGFSFPSPRRASALLKQIRATNL